MAFRAPHRSCNGRSTTCMVRRVLAELMNCLSTSSRGPRDVDLHCRAPISRALEPQTCALPHFTLPDSSRRLRELVEKISGYQCLSGEAIDKVIRRTGECRCSSEDLPQRA